jgi:serine/threonine protein phosphatase PrpC
LKAHQSFMNSHSTSERSGTTATVAVLFQDHLMLGHVGDSRAVLCCDDEGIAIQLTKDHTPYDDVEADRVIKAGGFIEHYGVLRVNGKLAVTRSLGDRDVGLREVLSEKPDILLIRLNNDEDSKIANVDHNDNDNFMDFSNSSSSDDKPCKLLSEKLNLKAGSNEKKFLILGSDGLWDVMSNQDAVDFVCDNLLSLLKVSYNFSSSTNNKNGNNDKSSLPEDAMHETSRLLAQEAFVRGSMDNIGVCIASLSSKDYV